MNPNLRNPNDPIENLAIGTVIEVDGTHIVAELNPNLSELSRVYSGEVYPIGQYGSILRIHFGRRLIYGFVGRLRMKAEFEAERGISSKSSPDERVLEADLFGEGEWTNDPSSNEWVLKFERGVATYPLPQQTVYLTPKAELRYIYSKTEGPSIHLGTHVGSADTPCFADMNELLNKHTAVLGTTGAGKSAAVAVIIHGILERGQESNYKLWNPRIIILDPHDEYGSAFNVPTKLSTDDGSLVLPYWMLDFQETISLLIGKTEFVATSQANIVKDALIASRKEGAESISLSSEGITVDSPIPYSLEKFKEHVNNSRTGSRSAQGPYDSILQKLETLINDARLNFLMKEWKIGDPDTMADVISQLTGYSNQPCIIDLSGVPNDVAGVTSAVIARTLFNLKVWQSHEDLKKDPVLLVCEEAHRYVPNSGEAQYEAAQESIRRIAKEGRKYGIGLMLVSQRPSDVEATVLSQCNSWLVLRITNEADRNHVVGLLPDAMSGLGKMLSGLRRQEAIFVGQAAMLPSRIMMKSLEDSKLPESNDINFDEGWQNPALKAPQLADVVSKWRYQRR